MVKEGACVIDVGITEWTMLLKNRDSDCSEMWIMMPSHRNVVSSPVPGGVGPMTRVHDDEYHESDRIGQA